MNRSRNAFVQGLGPQHLETLQALVDNARQRAPADWVRWFCGPVFLGYLSQERAAWLSDALGATGELQATSRDGLELHWDGFDCNADLRSARLQAVLEAARAQGLLVGWRNERFSFWSTHDNSNTIINPAAAQPWQGRNALQAAEVSAHLPAPDTPYFLSVERSGFRFLGMMSHAVHINGFTPRGHLWCARRAQGKATDPGMLDNITAGGLPTGESALECALRELQEEAGITPVQPQALIHAGSIRIARTVHPQSTEPQGYHDELLQVFNLTVPDTMQPQNRDGEVAEFLCLSPHEVMQRIARGEFTVDAAAALAMACVPVRAFATN